MAPLEGKLSLDTMLNLAEKVKSWEYYPTRNGGLFGAIIPEHYSGEINGITVEVGQRIATLWGGYIRYIQTSHGNVVLGEYPSGLEQDNRLNVFFSYSIPNKIRGQATNAISKISKCSE